MTANFRVKMGEICWLTFSRRLGILNEVEYRNSDLKGSFAMIWLRCIKIGKLRSSNCKVY